MTRITAKHKYLIFLDFDGTVTSNDVARELLDNFGNHNWRETEKLAGEGKISLRQAIAREYTAIHLSRHDMERYSLKFAKIAPGFLDFVNYIRHNDIPLIILSDGIKTYITAILKDIVPNFANDLTVIANDLKWKNGSITKEIVFPNEECQHGCATCKPFWIEYYKKLFPMHHSIFIGDGYTDRLVVKSVQTIFAKRNEFLDRYLAEKNIPHYTFSTFSEVKEKIEKLHI